MSDGDHNGSREFDLDHDIEDDDTIPPVHLPPLLKTDLLGRIGRVEEEQLSVRKEVRSVRSDVGKVGDKVTAVLRGMGTIHTEVGDAVKLMQAATDAMNGRGFTRPQTWVMALSAFGMFVAISYMAWRVGHPA